MQIESGISPGYTQPMIERQITSQLVRLFEQYPFVTVTGPRQSGKTTLCRATFWSLESILICANAL